jgi:hypothetical protein
MLETPEINDEFWERFISALSDEVVKKVFKELEPDEKIKEFKIVKVEKDSIEVRFTIEKYVEGKPWHQVVADRYISKKEKE